MISENCTGRNDELAEEKGAITGDDDEWWWLLLVLLQLMKSLAADMEPESSEGYIGGETGRLLHSAVYNVIVLSSEFANRLKGHTVSCVFS